MMQYYFDIFPMGGDYDYNYSTSDIEGYECSEEFSEMRERYQDGPCLHRIEMLMALHPSSA